MLTIPKPEENNYDIMIGRVPPLDFSTVFTDLKKRSFIILNVDPCLPMSSFSEMYAVEVSFKLDS